MNPQDCDSAAPTETPFGVGTVFLARDGVTSNQVVKEAFLRKGYSIRIKGAHEDRRKINGIINRIIIGTRFICSRAGQADGSGDDKRVSFSRRCDCKFKFTVFHHKDSDGNIVSSEIISISVEGHNHTELQANEIPQQRWDNVKQKLKKIGKTLEHLKKDLRLAYKGSATLPSVVNDL